MDGWGRGVDFELGRRERGVRASERWDSARERCDYDRRGGT